MTLTGQYASYTRSGHDLNRLHWERSGAVDSSGRGGVSLSRDLVILPLTRSQRLRPTQHVTPDPEGQGHGGAARPQGEANYTVTGQQPFDDFGASGIGASDEREYKQESFHGLTLQPNADVGYRFNRNGSGT